MLVVDKLTSVEALTSRWHKLDDLRIQSPSVHSVSAGQATAPGDGT